MNEKEFLEWMSKYAKLLEENKELLTDLDSKIGDGDHGTNMNRGFQAVIKKLETAEINGIGSIAKVISSTLISTVGGASGPLYGTFFLKLAVGLANKKTCTSMELADSFEKGCAGIQALGKSKLEDKTMLEALIPAVEEFKKAAESGAEVSECFVKAEAAAKKGMEASIPLLAKKGRASYLGERSVGHQDPGATSIHLLFKAAI